MVGDVESLSGSYRAENGAFETDFTGGITNGVYSSSKDFSNQTYIKSYIGMGLRPLGSTVEFRLMSSNNSQGSSSSTALLLPINGKFLDEQFVYPPNHQFVIGTSKDTINNLIYKGTQNFGGETLESEALTDLSTDAFYSFKNTSGGSNYTLNYEVT